MTIPTEWFAGSRKVRYAGTARPLGFLGLVRGAGLPRRPGAAAPGKPLDLNTATLNNSATARRRR
jgi:hypothetical protein